MTPTLKFLATIALTTLLLNACVPAQVHTADIATENGISFLHLNDTYISALRYRCDRSGRDVLPL